MVSKNATEFSQMTMVQNRQRNNAVTAQNSKSSLCHYLLCYELEKCKENNKTVIVACENVSELYLKFSYVFKIPFGIT